METKNIESGRVVDDGARHADTLTRKERMPLFEKNGLETCKDVKFSIAHKRRALALVDPD